MKRIIKNKVFDTETARAVGTVEHGDSGADTRYSETLYRKKTGEYFVYGQGGSNTRYAVADDSGWIPGENIMQLRYEQAREWAKAELPDEIYRKEFVQEESKPNANRTTLTVCLDSDIAKRFRLEARKRGLSLSDLMAEILKAYM